ncbi:hypothetical protein CANARDRAFT_30821 [[Candida] arabinofermentans NRRL YB-2248]|uniref:Uncharacterized protein n=1 Tax=[Candida] arabinofermentans NRRL YB-2248 TaxID=983967 RepID=A0A1E4SSK2_9ASCO|nr:hypothetical protein CANARDRAFT_30821 [[Candida] arabinofermentans NRRL YB-2248]
MRKKENLKKQLNNFIYNWYRVSISVMNPNPCRSPFSFESKSIPFTGVVITESIKENEKKSPLSNHPV